MGATEINETWTLGGGCGVYHTNRDPTMLGPF